MLLQLGSTGRCTVGGGASDGAPSRSTPSSVSSTTTEVRWCFPGRVPSAAVDWIGGRPRRRVDRYVTAGAGEAVKVRHVGTAQQRVERKILVAATDVEEGTICGVAETWSKSVLEVEVSRPGVDVVKVRWRNGSVEVVDLDDGRWWSVGVRLDDGTDLGQVFAVAPFVGRLTKLVSMSYPAALLALSRTTSPASPPPGRVL